MMVNLMYRGYLRARKLSYAIQAIHQSKNVHHFIVDLETLPLNIDRRFLSIRLVAIEVYCAERKLVVRFGDHYDARATAVVIVE